MPFQRTNRKYIGGTLIGSSAVLLAIALVSALYYWYFLRTASRTDGRIIRMIEHRDRGNHTTYFPVFTFQDESGSEHTIHASGGTFPPAYEIGDKVPVLYSPTNPTSAKIDSFFYLWGPPSICGIIGGIELPSGLIVWFWPVVSGAFRRKEPVCAAGSGGTV